MNNLTHYDIKYLTGVGPKRAEILAKELDIKSFHDMLYNFPFRYIDRSTIHHICDLRGADIPSVQLKGRFVTFNTQGEARAAGLSACLATAPARWNVCGSTG